MVLELQETGKLNAENTRKGRFSEFMTQLYFLIGLIVNESQRHSRTSLLFARALNANVAYFLSDILGIIVTRCLIYNSLMYTDIGDRGQVFRLIHLYVHKLDPGNESVELVELKFSFLRILSYHDYFIPLNMPSTPVDPVVQDIFSAFLYVQIAIGHI